jgi:hypothetical protein
MVLRLLWLLLMVLRLLLLLLLLLLPIRCWLCAVCQAQLRDADALIRVIESALRKSDAVKAAQAGYAEAGCSHVRTTKKPLCAHSECWERDTGV